MNINENPNEFVAGQIDADRLTDLDAFLAPGAHLDTKRYLLGVFAGLNMKLGRLQAELDTLLDSNFETYAEELETEQIVPLYTTIQRFAAILAK